MTPVALTNPTPDDVLAAILSAQREAEDRTAFTMNAIGCGPAAIEAEAAVLREAHAKIRIRIASELAVLLG